MQELKEKMFRRYDKSIRKPILVFKFKDFNILRHKGAFSQCLAIKESGEGEMNEIEAELEEQKISVTQDQISIEKRLNELEGLICSILKMKQDPNRHPNRSSLYNSSG